MTLTTTSEPRGRYAPFVWTYAPNRLANLHRDVDATGFTAYGWPEASDPDSLEDEEMLRRLPALNLERAGKE